jgi:hypothetical protein
MTTKQRTRMTLVLLSIAALVGCSSVQLDPQRPAATTLAPFNAQLGMNRVSVPVGSQLAPALVDGQPSYCTMQPAWFTLGESRSVCFLDERRSGNFDSYYVTGTLSRLRYPANIPYSLQGPFGPAQRADPALPDARDRQISAARQIAADQAECKLLASQSYQMHDASHPTLLGLEASGWSNQTYDMCMEAKAARRAASY